MTPNFWPALRPTIPDYFRLSSIAVSNAQRDLNLIQVRSTLVRARTMMANALRGLVKNAGGTSAGLFHRVASHPREGGHSAGAQGSGPFHCSSRSQR